MASDNHAVRDEDRLPWLETVEEDYDNGPSIARILGLVVIGLAVIAAAIFGYHYFQKSRGADGNGALIEAQQGDYKVKPEEPGGLKVKGEGDTAIATSDGAGTSNGVINLDAAPEAPVAGTKAKPGSPAPAAGAAKTVAPVPVSGGKLTAAPTGPDINVAGAGASGGSLVQLGSLGSEAEANAVWAKLSKRFTDLAPLGKSVQKAEVNGNTVYRLRVNAGSAGQAKTLCGKLKVAGEACFIPSN
ncbi:SPOR domain-containing protein [Sphingomonas sp. GB1N7]|uniref:SPOR domain-containing protein n=1 Tax=Parasphingomonas caseinilytica TaxID=3096158 RepID=UPI002FC5A6AE